MTYLNKALDTALRIEAIVSSITITLLLLLALFFIITSFIVGFSPFFEKETEQKKAINDTKVTQGQKEKVIARLLS